MNQDRQNLRIGLLICLLAGLLLGPGAAEGQASRGETKTTARQKQQAQKQAAAQTNLDPIHDSVPKSFQGSQVTLSSSESEPVSKNVIALETMKPLSWNPTVVGLAGQVDKYAKRHTGDVYPCEVVNKSQLYVFHITHWKPVATTDKLKSVKEEAQLVSSSWFAYTLDGHQRLKFVPLTGTANQTAYGKTKALVIGFAIFDVSVTSGTYKSFLETYATSVVQGTPENATNFGLLLSSVAGLSTATNQGILSASAPIYVLTVGCQPGTMKLPFTLTVTDTTIANDTDTAPQTPAVGSLKCTGTNNLTPCASTHSFVSLDREYWDVSVGLAVPGIRESKYTFTNSTVTPGTTRHTDFYGMLDLYWAGYWHPKDYPIPHPVFGLPLTSQTFYRPFFGMSETITGWKNLQRKLSLPVGINVFGGVVYMKTSYLIDSPTTQAEFNMDLKHSRVWKGVFGVEIPIASMASKLGKKSASSKGGASPGTAGSQ